MRGTTAKRLRKIAKATATVAGNEMNNHVSKIFVLEEVPGETDALGNPKLDWVQKDFERVEYAAGSEKATYKALKKEYKRG